ncbi:MAG: response regulator [Desulfobia sp.]
MNNRDKILVVNDIPNVLEALEEKLQDTGFEIVKANNDLEALAACLCYDFSAAVLDVRTLETTDYALLKKLCTDECTRRLPLIFISDSPEEDNDRLKNYWNGSSYFLRKPVETEALSTKVKDIIRSQEQLRKIEYAAGERIQCNRSGERRRYRQGSHKPGSRPDNP